MSIPVFMFVFDLFLCFHDFALFLSVSFCVKMYVFSLCSVSWFIFIFPPVINCPCLPCVYTSLCFPLSSASWSRIGRSVPAISPSLVLSQVFSPTFAWIVTLYLPHVLNSFAWWFWLPVYRTLPGNKDHFYLKTELCLRVVLLGPSSSTKPYKQCHKRMKSGNEMSPRLKLTFS